MYFKFASVTLSLGLPNKIKRSFSFAKNILPLQDEETIQLQSTTKMLTV